MRKLCVTAGLMMAMAGPALAGPKDNGYDLYVIADEVTQSAIYVLTHARETAAIEVFDNDRVQWMKDTDALKVIASAEDVFGPVEAAKDKGFAFSVKDEDVKISFPLLFFKHISIHASEDRGAQVKITSKSGEGDVIIRANDDDGAFVSIVDASADDAREFIDDIDDISNSVRKTMKREIGLD